MWHKALHMIYCLWPKALHMIYCLWPKPLQMVYCLWSNALHMVFVSNFTHPLPLKAAREPLQCSRWLGWEDQMAVNNYIVRAYRVLIVVTNIVTKKNYKV